MTNLTEQWKKGELPEGEYWCLSICGDVDKLYCYQNSFWEYKTEDDYYGVPVEIKEVLDKVPSYKEYQQLLSDQLAKNEGVEINAELEAKNTKLKSLLKESNNWLKAFYAYEQSDFVREQVKQCLTKINQELGEE